MKPFAIILFAATALFAEAAPKKLLVVTVTTGFRHALSIPVAEKALIQLAAENGNFTVDFVQQPSGQPQAPTRPKVTEKGEMDPVYQTALAKFEEETKAYQVALEPWMLKVTDALLTLSPEKLSGYDGVAFISTTGDLPLPDKQGLLDWIAAGHGFIGVHAAADTFHGFPAFLEMVGGEFKTHGPPVSVDCINEDPAHPATSHLPAHWTVFDEIYQFKNYDRAKFHGLLGLDKHPNDKKPGDYPLAWSKSYGTGRVFYTALGHKGDLWSTEFSEKGTRFNSPENTRLYLQHILGGILWALGLAPEEAKPQTSSK